MELRAFGGTWDNGKGRRSKVFDSIMDGINMSSIFNEITSFNGGSFTELEELGSSLFLKQCDVILWMPNVSNNLPKLESIKSVAPKSIVVTSKRSIETDYSFQDIMSHALSLKSNLVLEIKKNNNKFIGRLLDPLGNCWCGWTNDFVLIGKWIAFRSNELTKIIRQSVIQSPEEPDPIIPNDINLFLEVVKKSANIFHSLIQPSKNITRFLGNSSFRCQRGFPSVRMNDGRIYISQRNIDKQHIELNNFVQVGLNKTTNQVWYRGNIKPSVDTPIQVRLYEYLPQINYMIHSHCYINHAPFTKRIIPCGGLQEVNEILKIIMSEYYNNLYNFAINLNGHGSILFLNHIHYFGFFSSYYFARPIAEQTVQERMYII